MDEGSGRVRAEIELTFPPSEVAEVLAELERLRRLVEDAEARRTAE